VGCTVGANVRSDAARRAPEKRRERPSVRVGLLTLLSVVAIAGCGGSDSKDSVDDPKGAGAGKPARKLQKLDRQVASGRFATAQAAGTALKPSLVLLSIKATPPQKVQASWSLTCSKGARADTEDGVRDVQSPVSMPLRQPIKGSDSCVVAGTAQLTKSGRVIVKLASRAR